MSKNWYTKPGGEAVIEARYDGPALAVEPSMANELLVTLMDADGEHHWGYFNALDVLEVVIDRGKLSDPLGVQDVLQRALVLQ